MLRERREAETYGEQTEGKSKLFLYFLGKGSSERYREREIYTEAQQMERNGEN